MIPNMAKTKTGFPKSPKDPNELRLIVTLLVPFIPNTIRKAKPRKIVRNPTTTMTNCMDIP
jgi:hypothetical protein